MPEGDIRKKYASAKLVRGSQVIYGERQHLRDVLRTLRAARLPWARKEKEIRQLQKLVQARTAELNGISRGWDRRYLRARDVKSSEQALLKLVATMPDSDYLLARALSEHPSAPRELLVQLANHRYHAVRENVARHPGTPIETLRQLVDNASEPLWFLVACNPSTPPDLRERLRARMRAGSEGP